jgi:hypothetical protein
MKLKWTAFSGASGILAVLLICLAPAQRVDAQTVTPFIALSGVSVPELPAKASELVQAVAAPDREQTARDVLHVVSMIARPGVLPFVVSAICRGTPATAGAVVATAIELQPGHVLIFARTALCAAPGQVEQVVCAACTAAPASCANVALLASEQLPAATGSILAGLTGAMPYLKYYVEQAEIQLGTNDCQAVIRQAVQLSNDASRARAK